MVIKTLLCRLNSQFILKSTLIYFVPLNIHPTAAKLVWSVLVKTVLVWMWILNDFMQHRKFNISWEIIKKLIQLH